MALIDRIQNAWNAFRNRDPTEGFRPSGSVYSYRPDRVRLSGGNERSIITALYNRIAMDAASVNIKHVRIDENERYIETIDDNFNKCLTLEANIDQTARAFRQDFYMSLMDEGVVAIVPTDTTDNPNYTESYDIYAMRVGKIIEWRPDKVKVRLYNDRTGLKEDVVVKKKNCAIVENPFYAVMNSPNSTLRRLVRKLNLLDAIDEQSGSGKLDLIIQLPYVVKSEARQMQAEKRIKSIEDQLKGPYGIAYTDGTERITQLNRPVENNLMKQIEYLTSMLYSQLGMTQSILDGTADEQTMLNYNRCIIEPLVSAPVDEMKRKFITQTARSQGQSVMYFNDPFKLVPVSSIAEIADKFTRNEIMTSNELRQVVGMKPSKDPRADELRNKNLSEPADTVRSKTSIDENGTKLTENSDNKDIKDLVDQILKSNKEENQNG